MAGHWALFLSGQQQQGFVTAGVQQLGPLDLLVLVSVGNLQGMQLWH
jgi:hypothetical protein